MGKFIFPRMFSPAEKVSLAPLSGGMSSKHAGCMWRKFRLVPSNKKTPSLITTSQHIHTLYSHRSFCSLSPLTLNCDTPSMNSTQQEILVLKTYSESTSQSRSSSSRQQQRQPHHPPLKSTSPLPSVSKMSMTLCTSGFCCSSGRDMNSSTLREPELSRSSFLNLLPSRLISSASTEERVRDLIIYWCHNQ